MDLWSKVGLNMKYNFAWKYPMSFIIECLEIKHWNSWYHDSAVHFESQGIKLATIFFFVRVEELKNVIPVIEGRAVIHHLRYISTAVIPERGNWRPPPRTHVGAHTIKRAVSVCPQFLVLPSQLPRNCSRGFKIFTSRFYGLCIDF